MLLRDEVEIFEFVMTIVNGCMMMSVGLGSLIHAIVMKKNTQTSSTLDETAVVKCAVLMPLYMPNERGILQKSLDMLSNLSSAGEIIVPINGADANEVKELSCRQTDSRIRLVHVEHSKSKAENLNAAIDCITLPATLVLDADHVIEDRVIRDMHRHLVAQPDETVCVQGTVLIRGNSGFEVVLSAFSWYFFTIMLPALETISGTAMFMGAMGMWRSDTLRGYRFDKTILSEDDDITMRCVRDGRNITAFPLVQATELAPVSLTALFRQRLRWAIGYEQSLNRHICPLARSRPRILFQRLYGWVCYTLVIAGILQGTLTLTRMRVPKPSVLAFQLTFLCGAFTTIIVSVVYALARQNWRYYKVIIPMIPFVTLYAFFQTFVALYARVRMLRPYEWNVTKRRGTSVENVHIVVTQE